MWWKSTCDKSMSTSRRKIALRPWGRSFFFWFCFSLHKLGASGKGRHGVRFVESLVGLRCVYRIFVGMDEHVNKAVSILGSDTAERGRYLKQLQTAAIWTAVIFPDANVKAFCFFLSVPGL